MYLLMFIRSACAISCLSELIVLYHVYQVMFIMFVRSAFVSRVRLCLVVCFSVVLSPACVCFKVSITHFMHHQVSALCHISM